MDHEKDWALALTRAGIPPGTPLEQLKQAAERLGFHCDIRETPDGKFHAHLAHTAEVGFDARFVSGGPVAEGETAREAAAKALGRFLAGRSSE